VRAVSGCAPARWKGLRASETSTAANSEPVRCLNATRLLVSRPPLAAGITHPAPPLPPAEPAPDPRPHVQTADSGPRAQASGGRPGRARRGRPAPAASCARAQATPGAETGAAVPAPVTAAAAVQRGLEAMLLAIAARAPAVWNAGTATKAASRQAGRLRPGAWPRQRHPHAPSPPCGRGCAGPAHWQAIPAVRPECDTAETENVRI
jgi:hypothetical protein